MDRLDKADCVELTKIQDAYGRKRRPPGNSKAGCIALLPFSKTKAGLSKPRPCSNRLMGCSPIHITLTSKSMRREGWAR